LFFDIVDWKKGYADGGWFCLNGLFYAYLVKEAYPAMEYDFL
jgi:hypothetical protein